MTTQATNSKIARVKANDATVQEICDIINRDGGVIVENFISKELAVQVKAELKPHFDADSGDKSGFFPSTTQRATGLVAKSPACVDLITTPLLIDVANELLSDTYPHWLGQNRVTVTTKPILSSTVGFRVNPGSPQQGLHRDDLDWHITEVGPPMFLGCVTAIMKTTKENGGTIVIPGSHLWDNERQPHDHEAVAAELEPGDTLLFHGHVYHAGGANTTKDECRETVGMFFNRAQYRPAENEFLEVPPDVARNFTPQVQRLLGYGVAKPGCGFYKYQDPMRVLFGVEDDETVNM
ncbi:phytanoyl-CoA dioxygenase family protein [Ilyonectria sp. MPI-CAGE-AT-0026]|nr:phytanoyl-CoA dioxygenase family protein [Ilyonectria sp. MPI-CAGE-AT-0026]